MTNPDKTEGGGCAVALAWAFLIFAGLYLAVQVIRWMI